MKSNVFFSATSKMLAHAGGRAESERKGMLGSGRIEIWRSEENERHKGSGKVFKGCTLLGFSQLAKFVAEAYDDIMIVEHLSRLFWSPAEENE